MAMHVNVHLPYLDGHPILFGPPPPAGAFGPQVQQA